ACAFSQPCEWPCPVAASVAQLRLCSRRCLRLAVCPFLASSCHLQFGDLNRVDKVEVPVGSEHVDSVSFGGNRNRVRARHYHLLPFKVLSPKPAVADSSGERVDWQRPDLSALPHTL